MEKERGEVEDEALGARRMPRPSPAGDLDPVALEGDLLKRWSEEGAFEASIEARRGSDLQGPRLPVEDDAGLRC